MCMWVLCCGSLPELGPPLQWGDGGCSGVCWVGMRCSAVFTIVGGGRVLSFLCLLVTLVCMYIDKPVALWEAMSLLGWQKLMTLPLLTFSRESECSSRSMKSAKSSPCLLSSVWTLLWKAPYTGTHICLWVCVSIYVSISLSVITRWTACLC